ncbi:hypothetical protein D9619_004249 [Psilocybe cf. subviscida]|uniref:Uncharacterized protein n=1 Tax=Psilocybe cf. subviscida TaxID=2480587 RepID=A0A8H5F8C0_9AGAR|nr:hypothetical protein D9619_004249 [Psilocybe cf. subviscida]
MFAKFATVVIVALSALTSTVSAASLPTENTDIVARGSPRHFDNWGGFSSMNSFDNFYGYGNFDNSRFSSSQITIVKEKELVCHSQSIEIIQQRLLVLQEMAKRVITEQVCEVESQTIVFEQFYSSLHGFSRDLRRYSGRGVGYDSHISSFYNQFFESDGSLSSNDFGFSGSDLGRSYVVPSGNNWSSRSRFSVNSAYSSARSAVHNF